MSTWSCQSASHNLDPGFPLSVSFPKRQATSTPTLRWLGET